MTKWNNRTWLGAGLLLVGVGMVIIFAAVVVDFNKSVPRAELVLPALIFVALGMASAVKGACGD